jgi:hypothetical protein
MHADRQLAQLGRELHKFDLLESKKTKLGGEPAIFMRFAWQSAVGPLEQSVTMVSRKDGARHVVTTFTTSTPRDDAAIARRVFSEILASVAFEHASSFSPEPRQMPSRIVPRIDPRMADISEIPIPGTPALRR